MDARRLAACALAFRVLLASAPTAAQSSGDSPPPSGGDLVLPLPEASPGLSFRFVGAAGPGEWLPFDRPLRLSAAPGEERRYLLETRGPSGPVSRFEYSVDKRPPPPPEASIPPSLLREPSFLRLFTAGGEVIRYALSAADSGEASFEAFDPGRPIPLLPPAEGTRSLVILAYAEDGAGNRSSVARFAYRLAAPGVEVEAPRAAPAPAAPREGGELASPPRPEIRFERGRAELSYRLIAGSGGTPLVAVVPPGTRPPPEAFMPLEPRGEAYVLELSCPWGWSGELAVWFARRGESGPVTGREPISVSLADLPPGAARPPLPGSPEIVEGAPGQGGFIVFPAYDGQILVSIAGGPFIPYAGPIPARASRESLGVAWKGRSAAGLESLEALANLSPPSPLASPSLTGVRQGEIRGGAVTLRPDGPGFLRYELGRDGVPPREPGPASPAVGAELVLDCPPGEERSYVLRYRPFADESAEARGGESSVLRFGVDRLPPPPPRPLSRPPAYSRRPLSVEFEPSEGRILVALSVDGEGAAFEELDGPVEIPGSRVASPRYLLRAYAVDAAGNKSPEMTPIDVSVDLASLSVESGARPGGDGSPERPYASLEQALRAARAEGRPLLRLSGVFVVGSPLLVTEDLFLEASTPPGGTARGATLHLPPSAPGKPALQVRGARLSLKGIALSATGTGVALAVDSGGLAARDSTITLRSGGDATAIRAESAELSLIDSGIELLEANGGAGIDATGGTVRLERSSIASRAGVRYFAALSQEDGRLELVDSLVESEASLSAVLVSANRSELLVERCLLRAQGGGYFRAARLEDSRSELWNSWISVEWGGDAVLFESSGGSLSLVHDTLVGESLRGTMLFFDARGAVPGVWNSILSAPGGTAILLRSDLAPGPGAFVADCVWGFGLLATGAAEISDLEGLERLNASSPLFASTRHVSESPAATFAAPLKNLPKVRRGSACIDAAYRVEGHALDWRGNPRPALDETGRGKPDIGAVEFHDR